MAVVVPEGLKDTSKERLCAILEVLYYVARSDGVFSHEEITHFLRVAETISGGRIKAAELGLRVHEWARGTKQVEARIAQIAELFTDAYEREMVCNLAAQLAEADDTVLAPEHHMLELLGRTFFPR